MRGCVEVIITDDGEQIQLPELLSITCFPAWREPRGFLEGWPGAPKKYSVSRHKNKVVLTRPMTWPQSRHSQKRKMQIHSLFLQENTCLRWVQRHITIPKYFESFETNKTTTPGVNDLFDILNLQERFPENQPPPFRKKYPFYLNTSAYHLIVAGNDCLVCQSSANPSSRVNYRWHTDTEINLHYCLVCSPKYYKLGDKNADVCRLLESSFLSFKSPKKILCFDEFSLLGMGSVFKESMSQPLILSSYVLLFSQ